jgi:hypothetical protein
LASRGEFAVRATADVTVRALCRRGLLAGVLGVVLFAGRAEAQQGRTMTLQSVNIERFGLPLPPENWTLSPRDEVVATFPYGRARFLFPLPAAVPAGGGPATITLETSGTNFAPLMAILGQAVKEGRVDNGNYARSETATPVTLPPQSKTVTLDPSRVPAGATTTTVSVGMQDGPRYDYVYSVSEPPPPAPVAKPPVTRPPVTDATVTPAQAFSLPSNRKCVSRRNFRIRLKRPGNVKYIAAKVTVNGRQVRVTVANEQYRTIRGQILTRRRLTAQVDLRGLPKGTFRVGITAITKSLRTLRGARFYRTCEPKRR